MVINLKRSRTFRKHYRLRIVHNAALDHRYRERLTYFIYNPSHPLLKDHALMGSREGLRSFSITGDIRVIYQRLDQNTIELLDIGTHNQVYR